jgi:hypothetical protein
MKLKANSLFLGLGLTLLALAASPAYARSTTGFSAFHVEAPISSSEQPYTCLTENNGAVVNNCTYAVSLEFDLPIDTPGEKTIAVQNYWAESNAQESFGCTSYAPTSTSSSSIVGSTASFTAPEQNLNTSVDVAGGPTSIQVICWNIPAGGGVANFNWNP